MIGGCHGVHPRPTPSDETAIPQSGAWHFFLSPYPISFSGTHSLSCTASVARVAQCLLMGADGCVPHQFHTSRVPELCGATGDLARMALARDRVRPPLRRPLEERWILIDERHDCSPIGARLPGVTRHVLRGAAHSQLRSPSPPSTRRRCVG